VSAAKHPFHWDKTHWKQAGGIIFVGTTLYLFDDEITELITRNKTAFTKDLASLGNRFGEGKYVLPALGVTFVGGYLLDSPRTQDTALLALKSFLLANTTSQSLKNLTQRYRPLKDKGKTFFRGKTFSRKRDAFPSGHVTVIWSVAPILAEQYKDYIWVAPAAYTTAILTSYARLHDEKHWASDVFAGAVIGYLTSQLVLKTTPRLEIALSPVPQSINLSYRF